MANAGTGSACVTRVMKAIHVARCMIVTALVVARVCMATASVMLALMALGASFWTRASTIAPVTDNARMAGDLMIL